jgi:hypothetical protein
MFEQAHRLGLHASSGPRRLHASPRGEATWQADVLQHRQIRNEIKHLEDETDVVGTETIARRAAHVCHVAIENPHRA